MDQQQLAAALAACKKHKATLLFGKLDRLARNVAFIANLMRGGVERPPGSDPDRFAVVH
jgi:hypothetical protein